MVNLNLLVAFFVSTPTDRCLDPRQEQGAFPVTPERLGKLGIHSKFRTSGLTELEFTEFDKTLDECDHQMSQHMSMVKAGWHRWNLI